MTSTHVREHDLRRLRFAVGSLLKPVRNAEAYTSSEAIELLSIEDRLQAPEATILNEVGEWLADESMLDVGVGGGRTTVHFAPLVREYVGVDFSAPLVEACRRRFPSRADSFRVMDARDLGSIDDASIGFLLFSYNGIDTVGHVDRARVLREFSRVTRPGGYVCISSHNLQGLPALYRLSAEQRSSSYRALRAVVGQLLLRVLNPPLRQMITAPYAELRDGALEFRLRHYYVRPTEQLEQLHRVHLKDVRVFGLDGRELDQSELGSATDPWLYYLARREAVASSG
jgi:ubiquinone/menaquinone biosynthesis C-methylase UbiE